MTRHKRTHLKLRSMYQWHRYFGISAALFIILISVTGIMLNHTEDLNLDSEYVQNPLLLDWYGIGAPEELNGYRAGRTWISQWHNRLLTPTHDLGHQANRLLGAIHYHDMLILALEGTLILVSPEGEIIETLQGYQGVPAGIWAIGLTQDNRVAVKSAHGGYIADSDLLNWRHEDAGGIRWSAPSRIPEAVVQDMLRLYRGKGLDLERVILDLHSGRLLGRGGIYFFDFIALAMLFLAISGMWLWTARKIKSRRHRHNQA